MERASSRAAAAAAATSALDFGRDLASACTGRQLMWSRLKGKERVGYFTLFAYSALRVGFLFTRVRGLCDCHGHVIVCFFGDLMSYRQRRRRCSNHGVKVEKNRNDAREALFNCLVV